MESCEPVKEKAVFEVSSEQSDVLKCGGIQDRYKIKVVVRRTALLFPPCMSEPNAFKPIPRLPIDKHLPILIQEVVQHRSEDIKDIIRELSNVRLSLPLSFALIRKTDSFMVLSTST